MSRRTTCLDCGVDVPVGRAGPVPRRCADCGAVALRARLAAKRAGLPRCSGITVHGERCQLAGRFLHVSGRPVCRHHQVPGAVLAFGL